MIITLSRQFGAGARTIGSALSQRLGYRLLDQEITRLVAEQLEAPEEQVALLEERLDPLGVRMLHSLAAAAVPEAGLLVSTVPELNADEVGEATHEVIVDLASRESIVIVGRGARWILGDRPDALHVRLVAPLDVRVERIMAREGLDRRTAHQLACTTDRERAAHVQRSFHADWNNPENYHLVLNTGQLSIPLVTDLIAQTVSRLAS